MRRKKTPEMTIEQYNAELDAFAEQRAKIDDLYMQARRKGEVAKCHRLYELWCEIVAQQRDWQFTHPAPEEA